MKRLLPDVQRLLELKQRGLNYQEIADWIEEHEGIHVSRMSVASAISRAGKSTPRPRYEKHIPWKVKAQHGQNYHAKMLRLMGRRDSGLPLNEEQEKRLTAWLNKLKLEHSVVVYDERTPEGFYLVDGDFNSDGIPISRNFRFSEKMLRVVEAQPTAKQASPRPLCERHRGPGRRPSL